jgi:UDPglucose 6-dehydrogenase
VHRTIRAELASRGVDAPFSIAANPEFLREGRAVRDFIRPDRIIVGTRDPRALGMLRRIYAPMLQRQGCDDPFIVMDNASAELTKYAANAMLAVRISFMNEIANLAERVGADIEQIRRGVGSDARIGLRFLHAGSGYGGSCLPKDVGGLLQVAHDHGLELQLLAATCRVNEAQKRRMGERIVEHRRGFARHSHRALGARFQAGHRRYARSAQHHAHRCADRAGRLHRGV